ncbi:MAG: LamG domain-containing protein, partial [Alphaproteobacteria bacterium]|nr:LamG domain-containing protein [Alphaproteobacteria bacterium]
MAQKTMTAVNQAQLDTAQKKFGTASLLFDGTGDAVTAPDSADWDFQSGDWSIDFWVRFASVTPVGGKEAIYFLGQAADNSNYWTLAWIPDGASSMLTMRASTDGGADEVNTQYVGASANFSADTWYHIGFARTGTTNYMFINGTSVILTTDTYTAIAGIGGNLSIGKNDNTGWVDAAMNGWMDEIRISKGTNLLGTTSFSLPTTEYPYAASNVLLLHGDGADASTTITDDSATHTSQVLVVAGGGSGGQYGPEWPGGGGGGAGGVIYNPSYAFTTGSYAITVGAGGTGTSGAGVPTSGANSVFNTDNTGSHGVLTAVGGGYGSYDGTTLCVAGAAGGSGGGGIGDSSEAAKTGGAGTSGQGYDGGDGVASGGARAASGGGGAGAEGSPSNGTGSSANGGAGGAGKADASIGGLLAMTTSGASGFIAGGGGGGGDAVSATAGSGGSGGGRGGGHNANGTAGTANTGGGGGGCMPNGKTGGNGGSGLVLVTYITADFPGGHTGGNSTGTSGVWTWVKFTADGTFVL